MLLCNQHRRRAREERISARRWAGRPGERKHLAWWRRDGLEDLSVRTMYVCSVDIFAGVELWAVRGPARQRAARATTRGRLARGHDDHGTVHCHMLRHMANDWQGGRGLTKHPPPPVWPNQKSATLPQLAEAAPGTKRRCFRTESAT